MRHAQGRDAVLSLCFFTVLCLLQEVLAKWLRLFEQQFPDLQVARGQVHIAQILGKVAGLFHSVWRQTAQTFFSKSIAGST